MDFLRYDSHGGEAPAERVPRLTDPFGVPYCGMNPILLGKKRHGQFKELRLETPSRHGAIRFEEKA